MENINIFFRDPNTNLQFIAPPFKIKESIVNPGQDKTFDLKPNVNIKLAEDPHTKCKDYEKLGQYENCREEELSAMFQSLIGCVPMWFVEQPGHCGRQTVTEETADIVFDLLFGIEKNSFKSKCLQPCTSVEYVVEL